MSTVKVTVLHKRHTVTKADGTKEVYHKGDTLEVPESHLKSMGDRLAPVGSPAAETATTQAADAISFVESHSVEDVKAAVAAGEYTAAEVLVAEKAGKDRVTLVSHLEDLIS